MQFLHVVWSLVWTYEREQGTGPLSFVLALLELSPVGTLRVSPEARVGRLQAVTVEQKQTRLSLVNI